MNKHDSAWRKSSRSNGTNNCVEVATVATWHKSSRSNAQDNCVEVAGVLDAVAVRDSKRPDGGNLLLPRPVWAEFRTAVRSGQYDL